MEEKLLKIFPLVKVDEAAHMVWGVVTSETPDSDGEICDYPSAKDAVKAWSDDTFEKTTAAGQEPSLGNMRVMHQLEVGGKAIKIEYRDEPKQIWVGSTPANEDVWHLLKGGFLTGHSIGGSYKWKRADGEHIRYAPTIGEISYVDKGSNPDASFSYVKADGSTELRKFSKLGEKEEKLLAKLRESQLQKLGDDEIDRIAKAISIQLGTGIENLRALVSGNMAKTTAAGDDMNKEQVKKCAAALGISEEEFTKQFIEGDALQKGAKGLSALHAHLKKALAHHEKMSQHHAKMSEMHKAHGEMHAEMGDHMENCMKAHGACMDGAESEKALADLLAKLAEPKKEEPKPESMTKAEIDKAVADAVAKGIKEAMDKLPETSPAKLFSLDRDTGVKKEVAKTADTDPLPV